MHKSGSVRPTSRKRARQQRSARPISERRDKQLARTLQLIQELARLGDGSTLEELAQRHGVDTRTIRRDLAALQVAGFPVVEDEDRDARRKRWRIDLKARENVLTRIIGVGHYLGLRVAMASSTLPPQQWAVHAGLEDLSDRIEKALGLTQRKRLLRIVSAVAPYERAAYLAPPAEVLECLIEAIAEGQVCSIDYLPPLPKARIRTLRVRPLRVFPFHGAMYIHGLLLSHQRVITLHLGRVKKLQLEKERVPVPASYDPAEYDRAAFGVFVGGQSTTYRLRFDPAVAPRVNERRWHPTQVLEPQEDGSVVLTFTCAASPEVEAWVASWRGAVEVLAPSELRESLGAYGRWLMERYGGGEKG
jgi:predicted DNA-binding transcriptional regulator YafY